MYEVDSYSYCAQKNMQPAPVENVMDRVSKLSDVSAGQFPKEVQHFQHVCAIWYKLTCEFCAVSFYHLIGGL